MNIGFGAQRHLYDMAAAIRRGDCAAADTALDLFVRDSGGYFASGNAEAVACGRASVHAHPKPAGLRKAA